MNSEATKNAQLSFLNLNVDRAPGLPVTAVMGDVGPVQKPLEGRPSLPRQFLDLRL